MDKRIGQQSITLPEKPIIAAHYSLVGAKEGEGPLGTWFDEVAPDDMFGQDSFEKAERALYTRCVQNALQMGSIPPDTVDLMLGGDLLNQMISASFAARELALPFFGLYSACSTATASLLVGGMLADAGFAARVVCATVSHFSTAERQYRLPLEQGAVRAPTAQRTVTGAGAFVVAKQGMGPRLTGGTVGKVIDMGVKDQNNMGAAMAPAVADTLSIHFTDNARGPADYDAIVTGDLGRIGSKLLYELMTEKGHDIIDRHFDCGGEIFAPGQEGGAGGSGCGCCAAVLSGYVLKQMQKGAWNRVLVAASGALLSLTTCQQGETIPGISHAIVLENA